jgi:uncharacterized protein (DUF2235 family)
VKPPVGSRNLVVLCDGTNNEIGVRLSNVMKLYRVVDKDANQIAFYHPGIGTVRLPDNWGRWRQAANSAFQMGTGYGLDEDVLDIYRFLCSTYRPGDRIYLFGFSRGAYTVRVVAGLVYLIGLLREHQVNFAEYAIKAYKTATQADDYEIARQFSRTVTAQWVPIHFMGVWDTVSSVIVPGRTTFARLHLEELPFTSRNPAVEVFRHAMAIDEFRRMFRVKPWAEPQIFKPNQFSQRASFPHQDIRQVWFAGCHADVGGGYAEEESQLAKYPLIWMIEQAKQHGLRVRTQMVNHLARGKPIKGAHSYVAPDPKGELHKSLSAGWWPAEIIPKSLRRREWPERRSLLGFYLPLAEPRPIPSGSLVHWSVMERAKKLKAYAPVNLPPKESVRIERA